MIGPQSTDNDPKALLTLKRPEPSIVADDPWADDWLQRSLVAKRLMVLLETHDVPFAISIDGGWGSGKTFLLKRWQQQLANDGYHAIYFNAWEDDFCSDPLLSIIGHLAEHATTDNTIATKAKALPALAMKLLPRFSSPLAFAAYTAIFNEPVPPELLQSVKSTGQALAAPDEKQEAAGYYLMDYAELKHNRAELRDQLESLSNLVAEKTRKPLVFIIDELDRCRPTYAIELLERVKHILSVPGIVFVFGVNRDELCHALKSVYGEIDADVYLRRFFDMEFGLPKVDTEDFCRSVFAQYRLHEFFRATPNELRFHELSRSIVELWSQLGLSLRDIDYGARLIALLGKSLIPEQIVSLRMVGILVPLKLKNSRLYNDFICGDCTGNTVMDFIDETVVQQTVDADMLDVIEAILYISDRRFSKLAMHLEEPSASIQQLKDLVNGLPSSSIALLSKRLTDSDSRRRQSVLDYCEDLQRGLLVGDPVREAAQLIDLHHRILRR